MTKSLAMQFTKATFEVIWVISEITVKGGHGWQFKLLLKTDVELLGNKGRITNLKQLL